MNRTGFVRAWPISTLSLRSDGRAQKALGFWLAFGWLIPSPNNDAPQNMNVPFNQYWYDIAGWGGSVLGGGQS